jgi:hypothetical protein
MVGVGGRAREVALVILDQDLDLETGAGFDLGRGFGSSLLVVAGLLASADAGRLHHTFMLWHLAQELMV